MKHQFRRWIGVLLSLCILLGLCPWGIPAAGAVQADPDTLQSLSVPEEKPNTRATKTPQQLATTIKSLPKGTLPGGLAMYNALQGAHTYLVNGNSGYPTATYDAFVDLVEDEIATYQEYYNTNFTNDLVDIQPEMLSRSEDLWHFMELLKLEKNGNYLDMAVEVLDFRADGILFQGAANSPYALSSSSPASITIDGSTYNFPGVSNLIEPNLVDGHVVYKEAAVSYVAAALFAKHSTAQSGFDTYYNKAIQQKINTLGRIGSWAETIGSTTTHKNGGTLRWADVNTAFDLAYYILTNLWRETDKTDVLQTEYHSAGHMIQFPYNLKENNLHTLRLKKNADGVYAFRSSTANGRNKHFGQIFNTERSATVPAMNILYDLGFESSVFFRNDTTGAANDSFNGTASSARRNYYYGLHGTGTFIYDGSTYFTITASDDVYCFVNGTLVGQMGGTHGVQTLRIDLSSLGLTQGLVCSLDLFWANRQGNNGANFEFETNAKLTSDDYATKLMQYHYTDSTEIGNQIQNEAVVSSGYEIGYGYQLFNTGSSAVSNISFIDDLGVSLSTTEVNLNGRAKAEDLIFIYRTFDPHLQFLDTAIPTASNCEFDTIAAYLQNDALPTGIYRLTNLEASQIQVLMFLGLPANVQLEIYGVHQTVSCTADDPITYSNTLRTVCTVAGGTACSSANRVVHAKKLSPITAEPLQIVIDYGKSIEFPISDLLGQLQFEGAAPLTFFVGLRESGRHGDTFTTLPTNLACAGGDLTLETAGGKYMRSGSRIRFTPTQVLESVERTYAVISIQERTTGTEVSENKSYYMLALEIIPANIMYYETEDFPNRFLYEEYNNGSLQDQWVSKGNKNLPTDPSTLPDEEGLFFDFTNTASDSNRYLNASIGGKKIYQYISNLHKNNGDGSPNRNYDASHSIKSTNEGELQEPDVLNNYYWWSDGLTSGFPGVYDKDPLPAGKDFNGDKGAVLINTGSGNQTPIDPKIPVEPGTMYTQIRDEMRNATSIVEELFFFMGNTRTEINNDNRLLLQYTAGVNDYIQVRVKIENTLLKDPTQDTFRFYFRGYKNGSQGATQKAYRDIPAEFLNGEYFYITIPFSELMGPKSSEQIFMPGETINSVWFGFADLDLTDEEDVKAGRATDVSKITVDYVYVGPLEEEALFFDFTDVRNEHLSKTKPFGFCGYDTSIQWAPSNCTAPVYSATSSDNTAANTEASTLTTTVTGANPSIELRSTIKTNHLCFDPVYAQMAQLRLKLSDLAVTDSTRNPYVSVQFTTDDNTTFTYELKKEILAEHLTKGEYFTVNIPVQNLLDGVQKITNVRLTLGNVQSAQGASGTVTLDYLYIGKAELQDLNYVGMETASYPKLPSNVLYFDYGNSTMDQVRYESPLYGNQNYDLPGSWAVDTSRATASIGNGALTFASKETYGSETHYQYIHSGTSLNTCTLNYAPTGDDYCVARLRIDNAVWDGQADSNYFMLEYTTDGSNWIRNVSIPIDPEYIDKGYFNVSFPVNFASTAVKALRFKFNGFVSKDASHRAAFSIDYLYVGPEKEAPLEDAYGYDYSYRGDGEYSDGESLFAIGRGTKLNESTTTYSQAKFVFIGTGFDLISRTGKEQASIRVSVYTDPACTDQSLVKALTMINKGELELNQIPVVSIQGLEHGTYYVVIGISAANDSIYDFLDFGGEFYFDAVRIYDPIDTEGVALTEDQQSAKAAYQADGEDFSHVKEVRNILLSASDFSSLEGSANGAVYVDYKAVPPDIEVPDPDGDGSIIVNPDLSIDGNHNTLVVDTYNKVGPKNEVYLSPGQAVAFKLVLDSEQLPAGVNVGAKTITDSTATLAAGFVSQTATDTSQVLTAKHPTKVGLYTSTAMYYPVKLPESLRWTDQDGQRCAYFVVYNATNTTDKDNHVLSITDIKVAYSANPDSLPKDSIEDSEILKRSAAQETAPVHFMVDKQTAEAAAVFIRSIAETPICTDGTQLLHSLNLASDISVNYAVTKESMAEYDSFYLEVQIPHKENPLRIDPVEKDSYYYFTLEGITAVQMGDELTATLYMEKDGKTYYQTPDTYSIAKYAYAQLSKDGASPQLKTLCAELLRYGAKAQIFKNYRTDALVDSAMTEEQKLLLTDLNAVTFGNNNQILNDLAAPTVTWVGKSLSLDSKVTLKFVFNIDNFNGEPTDLNLRVSYTDLNGKTVTATVRELESYNPDAEQYAFSFDGLLAAELRSVVSVQVCAGDEPVSCTLQYSADTYGNNKTGVLSELCKALFAYSDCAKAFFQ